MTKKTICIIFSYNCLGINIDDKTLKPCIYKPGYTSIEIDNT